MIKSFSFLIVFTFVSMILLTSCEPNDGGKSEKDQMQKDFTELKQKIDQSISELDSKIKNSNGFKEKVLKKAKRSLEDKSDDVKTALKKLENSSEEDFDKIQADLKKLAKKAEVGLDDIFEEIKKSID